MSNSTRLNEAVSLLLQSPPGQTSQVYHDLRGILFDSESNANDNIDDVKLQSAAAAALEEYNMQQLVTATLPGKDDVPVIICEAGQIADANVSEGTKRYLHPKLGKTFVFDHVKRTVSDVKEARGEHEEVAKTRAALEKAIEEYVRDRYPDGVSSVFSVYSVPAKEEKELVEELEKAKVEDARSPAENTASVSEQHPAQSTETQDEEGQEKKKKDDDDPVETTATIEAVSTSTSAIKTEGVHPPKTTFAIHHVGNRFNLSNFWSGRWRASYTLDPTTLFLTSTLSVQVHYFENGNVQLNAAKPRTYQLPLELADKPDQLANEVAKVVGAHEDAWQIGLESSYDELAERAFKALRRLLPLTRQKVDWDKVLNYKLGDELGRT